MPKTILIVEDQESLRHTLHSWIAALFPDCHCVEAASGEEAIALSTAESPDVVLMDVELPGIDGVEATYLIRARAPDTRVVVVSVHDDDAQRDAALAAGAVAFIAKRNMHEYLRTTLAYWILAQPTSGTAGDRET